MEDQNLKQGQVRQIPKHNCFAWNNEIWHNNEEYNYISCCLCNRITHFSFKSLPLKLRFLFWRRISGFRGDRRSQK